MRSLLLIFFLFLSACAHQSDPTNRSVEILKDYRAHKYSNIYFAGQPPLDQFSTLSESGFATVINLRQDKENLYRADKEEKAVTEAGLQYAHIPMSGKKSLTDAQIKKITDTVMKYRDQGKVLVHCSSGNRAALWAGGHFYKDHGFSRKDSMKIAKELGLDNQTTIDNLSNYLKSKDSHE